MTEPDSEKLWMSVSDKNAIMLLAEELAPLFKSKIVDEHGNAARYISVKNVEFSHEIIDDCLIYYIQIDYLSDQGELVQQIEVKEFRDQDPFEKELYHSNLLEQRLILFRDVDPLPIVRIDKSKKQLIYAIPDAVTLDECQLDPAIKSYLFGRITAILHGKESISLNEKEYREIVTFLLNNLPYTMEEREQLFNMVEPHLILLPHSMGGYHPATTIEPGNILLVPKKELYDITTQDIDANNAFQFYIRPKVSQYPVIDRMMDISTLYVNDAYNEFKHTGGVLKTKTAIKQFLRGYLSITNLSDLPDIIELYPHGITLDIQMLLSFWLWAYSVIQQQGDVTFFKQDPDYLRFVYYLLLKKPFLML